MRLPSSSLLALSLLSPVLAACGDDPPAPSEVRAALRDDLGHVLRESEAASAATTNLPTGSAFGFATSALGGADAVAVRALTPALRPVERLLVPSGKRLYADPDQTTGGDALVQTLEQELFTDANYLGDGVFRVPASLVCTQTTYDETTGLETTAIDPECAQRLSDAQLRIRVAHEGDGLRFFVQVDADHDEPLSVLVAHDELALTVNLDDASAAMQALAPVLGTQAPNAELAGQITGSLQVLGAARARASLSFDRALSIKIADAGLSLDGPDAFRFASAAGTIVALELDANTPSARFDLGLGATSLHAPGDTLDPQATELDLGGATLNATFQGTTLTIENISLGNKAMTVLKGGQPAMTLALNPGDGHSLDATISVDAATGDETLTVSPRLDLQHSIDHALLGDEAPVYDVTRVQLDGSLHGTAIGGQVEVLTGSLSVTTTPAQYGFSASAGQCVQATDVFDDTTYTSYTTYSVGSCQ